MPEEVREDLRRCPLCGGKLFREGENLVCEMGDYSIEEKRFDELWEELIEWQSSPSWKYLESALSEVLLKNLRDLNQKAEKKVEGS